MYSLYIFVSSSTVRNSVSSSSTGRNSVSSSSTVRNSVSSRRTVRNSVSSRHTVRNSVSSSSVSSSSMVRNNWSCNCKLYACMPGLLTLVFLSCSHHTQCDQRGAKKYLLLQSKAMHIGSGLCVSRMSEGRHNCKV